MPRTADHLNTLVAFGRFTGAGAGSVRAGALRDDGTGTGVYRGALAAARSALAHKLKDEGFTLREMGQVLGVSYQRASELAAGGGQPL